MADTTAFDALVAKLPPDHQSCFVTVSNHLRTLQPDDDLAQALEVLGFAALVLNEIPGDVSEVIDRIGLGLSDRPLQEIEAALARWLDESCYNRLRVTLQQIRGSHLQSHRDTRGATKSLSSMCRWLAGRIALPKRVVFGLCAGAACGAILLAVTFHARPAKSPAVLVVPPVEQGLIGYHEAEIAELGGRVGMVFVGGEVLAAFKEGQRGVVVVEPLAKP